MNKYKCRGFFLFISVLLMSLFSCANSEPNYDWPTDGSVKFFYGSNNETETIGDKNNDESIDYYSLNVKSTTNTLRDDFAYGVDASMVYDVEKYGGVYYNQKGQEQDVFEIMRDSGVNFVRFRVWNDPNSIDGDSYGGGDNSSLVDLEMAKRAKKANLNVVLDFHYSDFWADPKEQQLPKEWKNYNRDEIEEAVGSFTKETLQKFKNSGVTVDAVQIGNEINNGFLFPFGTIDKTRSDSWADIAHLLSLGISAAKEVFPHIYSIIHLADGGKYKIFDQFFTQMDKNNLDYDIIGATYYPYWNGSLDELQENLNNVTAITKKPVMIMETAWGYTNDSNDYTENIYNSSMENKGNYLTSTQAQATCISDICDVLSKVPNNLGLGIFYWEGCWLPVNHASWATKYGKSYSNYGDDSHSNLYEDGKSTWSNQALFSYSGKVLPSMMTYKYLKNGERNAKEIVTGAKELVFDLTLKIEESIELPKTYQVITNYDALRNYSVEWNEDEVEELISLGKHVVHGSVGGLEIKANVTCVIDFVTDSGFELQSAPYLFYPWEIVSGKNNIKISDNSEGRTGKNDLNYYSDKDFGFEVKQSVCVVIKGSYSMKVYIEGSTSPSSGNIVFYCTTSKETKTYDASSIIDGWSEDKNVGFKLVEIKNIEISVKEENIIIGVRVTNAKAGTWGHIDDWSFTEEFD